MGYEVQHFLDALTAVYQTFDLSLRKAASPLLDILVNNQNIGMGTTLKQLGVNFAIESTILSETAQDIGNNPIYDTALEDLFSSLSEQSLKKICTSLRLLISGCEKEEPSQTETEIATCEKLLFPDGAKMLARWLLNHSYVASIEDMYPFLKQSKRFRL